MGTIINKNDEYICKIESYTSEGLGVAKIDGKAVFIPYTILNEIHKIRIVKVTNTVIYAISLKAFEQSPNRVIPECKYFGKCGGCHLQFMNYDEELNFKRIQVIDAINRIGKIKLTDIEIIPSPKIYRYRNKAVFNVSDNRIGFFKSRTHELIEIDDCILQPLEAVNIAKQINTKSLNHISIRDKVCTVYGKKYYGTVPSGITGLVLCNNKRDNSLLDGEFTTIWGNPEQIEVINNKKFYISPQSFFQVNPYTVDKLYNIACDYAGYGDTAVELYCGAGTISLSLSERFNKIVSIEIVPKAIENANRNKELNNINNVDFICGDASSFSELIDFTPDVLLVDPPRKGLSGLVIESILNILPNKIVYISCNPSTLARDINLISNYYMLSNITAIDMFPRTHHCETVCLLSKINNQTKL